MREEEKANWNNYKKDGLEEFIWDVSKVNMNTNSGGSSAC